MAVPGLAGTPVSPPVVSNHAIAAFAEEQHLCVPIIGGQWPAVAKYDGLTLAPVLVIDLRSIFRCNRRHRNSPCVFKSARIVDFAGCKHFERQHCPSFSKKPRITDRLVTRELRLRVRFSI